MAALNANLLLGVLTLAVIVYATTLNSESQLSESLNLKSESQNDSESQDNPLEQIRSQNPCSNTHSCRLEHRICRCDSECSFYGDCCFDTKKEPQMTFSDYTCYSLVPLDGVFVKSGCKVGWANEVVRRQCEEKVPADKSWFVPVTNSNRTTTYRNKYCAQCNEDDDIIQWELIVECPTLDDPNDTSGLIYDGPSDHWGVWVMKSGRSNFHSCYLRASMPYNVSKNNMRECIPNVKDQCSLHWEKESVREKCLAYYSPVSLNGNMYKNIHCAMCNGEDIQDSKCMGSRYQRNVSVPGFYTIYEENDDLNAQQSKDCKSDELYDATLRKCRGLNEVCKMMKLTYRDGFCVSL